MNEDLTLVVVVATKDRRALLERALGSVTAQRYPRWRAVIVNDGSSDGTRQYLETLRDPRIRVISFERSRGVNAARNAALRTLKEGEWAVQLDDDDMLLPGALESIASAIREAPPQVQVLNFNTVIRTTTGESVGGYQFGAGEMTHDVGYEEVMEGRIPMRGDNRPAWKWSLFPKYLFNEDINGFEGEWGLLLLRDGIAIRCLPQQIAWIDLEHPGQHLSATAARRDPASFARAHARIFRDHRSFLAEHPFVARERSAHAFKIALRAFDPALSARFAFEYLRASLRCLQAGRTE